MNATKFFLVRLKWNGPDLRTGIVNADTAAELAEEYAEIKLAQREDKSNEEVAVRSFRGELTSLVNRYSKENGSDTPDYILAEFLTGCLESFDNAVKSRSKHYKKY